jgi:PAS domain S-box-containing protein
MNIRQRPPFRSRPRLAEEFQSMRGSIADRLGDIITAHDPDGTYHFASAATKDVLGYEPDELIGNSPYEYVHPEDKEKVAIVHRGTLEGTPFRVSYRVRRSDASYIWVETSLRGVCDDETGEVKEIVCSTRPLEERRDVDFLSSDEYRASVERLQDVIREESIRPVYQPIYDLETGQVTAFEALSRFPGDPARGPDRWFAEAWDLGLGVPLELMAVRVAARALEEMPSRVGLSVNASPPTIAAGGFLDTFGEAADRVTVELTEHLNVENYEAFATKLQTLRSAGGTVAIDDFGAGYASLRHILKVRPEWIKLDISLTERIDENPVAYALANSLVSFAEEVGLQVIAEGIETEEELDALCEIGFRYGQGFYFGYPAPLDEVLSSLN